MPCLSKVYAIHRTAKRVCRRKNAVQAAGLCELNNVKGHAQLRSLRLARRETSPSVASSVCRTVAVASATGKFVMSWRFESKYYVHTIGRNPMA